MAVHTWAVMENGQCINIIELDPNNYDEFRRALPGTQSLVNIHSLRAKSNPPGIGWTFDGTTWAAPS